MSDLKALENKVKKIRETASAIAGSASDSLMWLEGCDKHNQCIKNIYKELSKLNKLLKSKQEP